MFWNYFETEFPINQEWSYEVHKNEILECKDTWTHPIFSSTKCMISKENPTQVNTKLLLVPSLFLLLMNFPFHQAFLKSSVQHIWSLYFSFSYGLHFLKVNTMTSIKEIRSGSNADISSREQTYIQIYRYYNLPCWTDLQRYACVWHRTFERLKFKSGSTK